jgi:septal ring factor EnvC (AmiA/AmiB activator)
VRPGQSVAAGQLIGSLPDRANPPARLYLEVRLGAETVDPAPLLAAPRPAD